jgi:hypothetical protein
MKQVMVGSVFAESERSRRWYELQLRFLDDTLGSDYEHVVFCNRCDPAMFDRSTVVGTDMTLGPDASQEHCRGLDAIWKHFKQHEHPYYLILDSDAFPYKSNWLERMLVWMREDDRMPERQWASAVRCENLDTFPHPCVMFIKGDFLHECPAEPFGMAGHENLLGYSFVDLQVLLPRKYNSKVAWLPITRTNTWAPHPILSASYGGMFYHHGSGSRPFEIRSVALRQFDHHVPRFTHVNTELALWAEISKNPVLFLKQLQVPQ